jgi:hypothetical protein
MRGSKVKEQRRAQATGTGTAPRRPRWPLFGGLAVLVVAVSLGAVLAGGDSDDQEDGDGGGKPIPVPEAPAAAAVAPPDVAPASAYRVVYRVEDAIGPELVTSTDVLAVRLPYESRLEHRDGPTDGGELSSATVTNQRFQFNIADGEEKFVTWQVPDPLYSSVSVETMEAAVEAGVAQRLGEETVAGEPCTRYSYRAAGDEILALGDDQQRVESCITPDGILVSETISLNGKERRRIATEIDRAPEFNAETFLTERNPDKEKDVQLVEEAQRVNEGYDPSDVERLGVSAPAGFKPGRAVGVGRQLGPASPLLALYVQSFVRDGEVVFVEELLSVSEAAPWDEAEGAEVDLGQGRTGRVIYRPSSTEVRVRTGDEFARVVSARPALALAVARTLTDNPVEPS